MPAKDGDFPGETYFHCLYAPQDVQSERFEGDSEPSGGYSGVFAMPGGLKPVSVEISVLNRNTMLILSRDRRVKGNRMVWNRVREKPNGQTK